MSDHSAADGRLTPPLRLGPVEQGDNKVIGKYSTLVNVLDRIRAEASVRFVTKYNPPAHDLEKTNQARARAFIHLFLKVRFGILDFIEREKYITDKGYDGGIDGYFIDKENKTIYFIQSKFRTTETNFETKKIQLDEVLFMDINRVLNGEERDEAGNEYNGRVKQIVREVREIEDIGRYKYKVVLLANLNGITDTKLKYLTGGHPAEIINHERCYTELVFPVISGTFFNASDLNIYIDLSNKNAGSKISYCVQTKYKECEITVLFVPTIEIAKILSKYKNSILKYNPRSYLEFEGQKVNCAIRETILKRNTNEFALFNNGITMISDETNINERIGQKNKAQLTVKNPQIINGGQTAYTLSRIYEENILSDPESIFKEKEVLLKVITLLNDGENEITQEQKIELIDEISNATNQQTTVINADRMSNDNLHINIQTKLFNRFGILYERKRGEFGDGLNKGYITQRQILERNLFFRIFLASNGNINKAKKVFTMNKLTEGQILDDSNLNNFYFGYLIFGKLSGESPRPSLKRDRPLFGRIYAMTRKYKPEQIDEYDESICKNLPTFTHEWEVFLLEVSKKSSKYVKTYLDKETQLPRTSFSASKWLRSNDFAPDVKNHFG